MTNEKRLFNEIKMECPKCKEKQLGQEQVGNDVDGWNATGLYICDNPDCGAECMEVGEGKFKLQ